MIRATQKVIPSFAAGHMQIGPNGSTLAASSDFGFIKWSLSEQPFQIQIITQSDLASNINGFPTRQPSYLTHSLRTQHRIRNQHHLVRVFRASFGLMGFRRTTSQQQSAKAATSSSPAVTCHRRHRTLIRLSPPAKRRLGNTVRSCQSSPTPTPAPFVMDSIHSLIQSSRPLRY